MRDMVLLMLAAVASGAIVSALHVLLLCLAGLVPWADYTAAALRYWVGDVIGIAVVTPFLLILLTRGRPLSLTWETAFQIARHRCRPVDRVRVNGRAAASALLHPVPAHRLDRGAHRPRGCVRGTRPHAGRPDHRHRAASPPAMSNVTAFQALMLVLTITGLAAGALVTERRRAEFQLRLQQDAQARLARLGSMGELAAALAHEINQPLTAAGTYSRVAAQCAWPRATHRRRWPARRRTRPLGRSSGPPRSCAD